MPSEEVGSRWLDDAARAGWLYYVGGKTQDEIARTLGVSRQRAQRLVSRAVAENLIRVRIEHPIAALLDIAASLKDKYGLEQVWVAPDIGAEGNLRSVAPFAAHVLETVLANPQPQTIGFGTGRALRATIEQMSGMSCPHHRLVSVVGNIAPDGTASVYEVLMRLADYVDAPHYPLPTPVFAKTAEEREIYMRLEAVKRVIQVAEEMDAVFVGIGQMDETAPLLLDGFLNEREWSELRQLGVVGEVCGRAFEADGNYVDSQLAARMTSHKVYASASRLVVGIASGKAKVEPIRAAIKGKIISALVTDEPTAHRLL